LLPIITLTVISFRSVSGQLAQQSRRQLQRASKVAGMESYEHLEELEAVVRLIALRLRSGYDPEIRSNPKARFTNLEHFGPTGKSRTVIMGKASRLPVLSAEQQKHLQAGNSLINVDSCVAGGAYCGSLIRFVDPARPEAGILMAEINASYIWDPEKLPFGVELCVFASGNSLSCEAPAPLQKAISSLRQKTDPNDRFINWTDAGTSYDSAYWNLFLKASFLSPDWTVVLTEKHEEVLAPMRDFRASFPFVILLALLAVVLLSSIQIRRTLVPLEKLTKGTEEVSAQHFETRVEVRSGDEFEHLAHSFNAMASRLGTQFHVLRIFNDIDNAILASLDRVGIISAVLQHLPGLLLHSCFAVALLSDPRLEGHSSLSLNISGQKPRGGPIETSFSEKDLELLQINHGHWLIARNERAPEFLAPLAGEGMTAFLVLPIRVDEGIYGALICAHPHALELAERDIEQTRQVADQLAVAFSNVQLMESLEQLHWGALTALARAIDAKSAWTAGHSERVTVFALRIGRAMGLSQKDLQIISRGGLLHDIGKIGTPPEILDKPGKLDPAELETMRDHVRVGVRILEPVPGLSEALSIVAQHHEYFNGAGYPNGLSGGQISLYARIFAVADCYDALISDRPYRAGLPQQKVIEMICSGSGTQFDPRVVDIFLRVCAEDQELPPVLQQSAIGAQA
jgi:putative nucleotidyltransferase with HDIG domain